MEKLKVIEQQKRISELVLEKRPSTVNQGVQKRFLQVSVPSISQKKGHNYFHVKLEKLTSDMHI